MDAPLYPPAHAFTPPLRVPSVMTSRDTPVAVLQAEPAAWALVTKLVPTLPSRIGGAALRPHLTNFSLKTLVQFGVMSDEQLPAIDKALATLGAVK